MTPIDLKFYKVDDNILGKAWYSMSKVIVDVNTHCVTHMKGKKIFPRFILVEKNHKFNAGLPDEKIEIVGYDAYAFGAENPRHQSGQIAHIKNMAEQLGLPIFMCN